MTGRLETVSDLAIQACPAKGSRQASEGALDFSIIIVNYNVREFLRQSLLSLQKALAPAAPQVASLSAEIIVVDNASDDGSVEMVRQQFPNVALIANRENLGFARANNQALRRAAGRLVVLINPDTVVQEDTFVAIRDFMENHPRTGMAGCKILNPDGTLQLACRRSFPTPWVAFTRLSGLSQLFPKSRWFGRYNLTYLPENEIAEVEAISGSFMAVRHEAIAQVGLLDEDFFLYGEDLDWCYRIRAAGWKIHYFPGTQIIHFKGESAQRSGLDNVRVFYQAMSLFVRKHFRQRPDGQRIFLVSYWLLHMAIWIRAAIAFAQSIARKLAVPLTDLLLMQVSMAVAVWLRFERVEYFAKFFVVDTVYSLIWLICLALFGCYRRSTYSFHQAFAAAALGFFINASLTFFFRQYAFSRAVVLVAGIMNIFLLSIWRLAVKLLHHLGLGPFKGALGTTLLGQRTVIVGDFASDGVLVEKLKMNINGSYDLVGLVSLDDNDVGKSYMGLPVLTSLEKLEDWLWSSKGNRIQQVIFSTQRIPFGRILEVMSRSRGTGHLSFKLVPSHLDVIIGKAGIDQVTDIPLLEIENRLAKFGPRLTKRLFDLTLAGFFLLFSAPVFLLAYLFRPGFHSRMVSSPDGRSLRLWQLVRGGRLAKWPWLLAILAGKLSWVGLEIPNEEGEGEKGGTGEVEKSRSLSPPPAFPLSVSEPIVPCSLQLPLGVTGLAQINRRAPLSAEEKNKLYLYYVTHYSPMLDMEILFRKLFRI